MSFRPFHENSPLDAPPLSDASAILVIDEDPAFQLGLKTFLREFVGFEKVITARSGQEALDFIRAEPSIEVVTLDSKIGGMSGIELLTQLRAQTDRPIAALMITGTPTESLKSEYHALGTDLLLTDEFLTKPVQFEKLEPVVLNAHESVREAKQRLLERLVVPMDDLAEPEVPEMDLADKIDAQTRRLDELQVEVRAQRGKWRADFWKIAFVAAVIWLASQFGLLDGLGERWQNVRAEVRDTISRQFEAWRTKDATPAAPAPGETPGRPL